jgi:hypothetical protein
LRRRARAGNTRRSGAVEPCKHNISLRSWRKSARTARVTRAAAPSQRRCRRALARSAAQQPANTNAVPSFAAAARLTSCHSRSCSSWPACKTSGRP